MYIIHIHCHSEECVDGNESIGDAMLLVITGRGLSFRDCSACARDRFDNNRSHLAGNTTGLGLAVDSC